MNALRERGEAMSDNGPDEYRAYKNVDAAGLGYGSCGTCRMQDYLRQQRYYLAPAYPYDPARPCVGFTLTKAPDREDRRGKTLDLYTTTDFHEALIAAVLKVAEEARIDEH